MYQTRRHVPGADSTAPTEAQRFVTVQAELLDLAVDLVRELGALDELTMRRLAQRAGTSATTLYRYFPGREALMRLARRRAVAGLPARLGAALADPHLSLALRQWVSCYASGDPMDPWLRSLDPSRQATEVDEREAAALVGLPSVRARLNTADRDPFRSRVHPAVAACLLWSGAHMSLRLRSGSAGCGEVTLRELALTVVEGLVSDTSANCGVKQAP